MTMNNWMGRGVMGCVVLLGGLAGACGGGDEVTQGEAGGTSTGSSTSELTGSSLPTTGDTTMASTGPSLPTTGSVTATTGTTDDPPPCGPGTQLCGDVCVDTDFNPAHCGGCDLPCAQGEVCSLGACGLTCGGGTTQCGDDCIDTDLDPAHCGGCDLPCAEGELCSAGQCGLTCVGGTTKCGDVCVATGSDPDHCGGCDLPCADGEVCSAGQCGLSCVGGTTKCGDTCVDLDNDPAHCGGCDLPCAQGEVCSAGQCGLSCAGGTSQCGDACVDLDNDPAHCGSCAEVCPGAPNAVATCSGQGCSFACVDPFLACNADAADGCEINGSNNVAHCGACGAACPAVANGTPACNNKTCAIGSCNPGFENCDGAAPNGCEVNKTNDVNHCGACNNKCGNGQSCVNSTCQINWPGAGANWNAGGKTYGRYTWAQAGVANNGRSNAMAFCTSKGGTLARPNSQVEWDALHANLPQDSFGYWIDGHNNFICGTATPGNPKAYQYGSMYSPTGTPLLYTGCNCNAAEQGLVSYRHSGGGPFDGCQSSGGMQAGYLGVMDEELGYSHVNIVGFVCAL